MAIHLTSARASVSIGGSQYANCTVSGQDVPHGADPPRCPGCGGGVFLELIPAAAVDVAAVVDDRIQPGDSPRCLACGFRKGGSAFYFLRTAASTGGMLPPLYLQ
jgi:hypothetical protein